MSDPTDLLRALRLRRHLGRVRLVRGKVPSRPDLSRGPNFGLGRLILVVGVPLAIVGLIAAAHALQLAVDLAIVLAVLLVVAPFRRWALPALRGGPLRASAFLSTSPLRWPTHLI